MKSIFSYRNYREILKEGYSHQKKINPKCTYASFGKTAGLQSPNYFKMVMDGKRNLTTANIHTFAQALGFSGVETDFFEAFVMENPSKHKLEKRYYAKRVSNLRKNHPKINEFVREKSNEILSNTMQMSLLLLAKGKSEETLLKEAASELKLPESQIKEMMNNLLTKQKLMMDEDGLYCFPQSYTMMHDPRGINEAQRKFLEEGLQESVQIFKSRYPLGKAKFLSLILSAPSESLNNMFSDLRLAAESISQKYEPLSGQEVGVYRMQVQVYRIRKDVE